MNKEKFENTFHSEQFEMEVLEKIKGIAMLMDAMRDSIEIGNHIYHKNAIEVISSSLYETIKKADEHHMIVANLDNELANLKEQK